MQPILMPHPALNGRHLVIVAALTLLAGCAAAPRMEPRTFRGSEPDDARAVRTDSDEARAPLGDPHRDRLQESFEQQDRQLDDALQSVKSLDGQRPVIEFPLSGDRQ